MATAAFGCTCGTLRGEVAAVPSKGLHLTCFCDSCRAGVLHCGETLAAGTPVDLYLTQPEHVKITSGRDQIAPFAFGPNAILRWRANCCGVQMFSSQASAKTAFMSVRIDRLDDPQIAGPVLSRAFVPQDNGKTRHEGKGALARLVLRAVAARISGKWRRTPLFDPATLKPVAEVTLVSKEARRALLAQNA